MKTYLGYLFCFLFLFLLSGCATKTIEPEKIYITETKYVILDIPVQYLQPREVPSEPKSHTRKALVQWQTKVLSQLLASNQDKKELRNWFESSKARWENSNDNQTKGEDNGTDHSQQENNADGATSTENSGIAGR